MANGFIIIATIILSILCFGVVGYMVILYTHPDEKDIKSSIVYKVFVVLGFTGGIIQIAMIPLDIENTRSDYGLSMYTAWTIILIFNAVMMVLIVPFMLFFYETDSDVAFVILLNLVYAYC